MLKTFLLPPSRPLSHPQQLSPFPSRWRGSLPWSQGPAFTSVCELCISALGSRPSHPEQATMWHIYTVVLLLLLLNTKLIKMDAVLLLLFNWKELEFSPWNFWAHDCPTWWWLSSGYMVVGRTGAQCFQSPSPLDNSHGGSSRKGHDGHEARCSASLSVTS